MTVDLHEAAVAAGATVLGDPPHYLFSEDQLAAFLSGFGIVVEPLGATAVLNLHVLMQIIVDCPN